jgi:hypothetical protein
VGAHVIESEIHDDTVKPRAELCVSPESRERLVCVDERLLQDVPRALVIVNETERDIVGLLHVLFHQGPVGGMITFLGLTDQLPLIGTRHAGISCV